MAHAKTLAKPFLLEKSHNDFKIDSLRLGGLARDDFSDVSVYKK